MTTTAAGGPAVPQVDTAKLMQMQQMMAAPKEQQLAMAEQALEKIEDPTLREFMRANIAREREALKAPKQEVPKVMSGQVPLLPSSAASSHATPPPPPTGDGHVNGVNVLRHIVSLHESMQTLHGQHVETQRLHRQTAQELSEVRAALQAIHNNHSATGKLVAELHSELHSKPE